MRVIGITNKLGHNLRLFMWEYDGIQMFDALEEANFLTQVFPIDIDVMQSSRYGFHLISFDVLTLDMVKRIQDYTGIEGDYLNIVEMPLFDDKGLWNTLRVGKKFDKASPKFLKRFINPENTHAKSLQHFRFYQFFCDNPDYPLYLKSMFVNLDVMISVYNTGIGAKRRRRLKIPLFSLKRSF